MAIRQVLKSVLQLVALLAVLPLLLLHWVIKAFSAEGLFVPLGQFLSLIPGKTGSYCRIAFYRFAMTQCHAEAFIGFNTLFSQSDTEINKGVYIGPQCNIGMCKIGNDTLIASGVHIMSGSSQHHFDDLDTPIQQQGGSYTKIEIGEDSWIGNGSLVMANVGKKCIVGAGSVVTKDIPDYSIVVGNPAKVIKSRLD